LPLECWTTPSGFVAETRNKDNHLSLHLLIRRCLVVLMEDMREDLKLRLYDKHTFEIKVDQSGPFYLRFCISTQFFNA
jgi:hypothetical protein